MINARRTFLFLLLSAIVLGSCAGQADASSTPDINASLTAGVGTLMANFFETQTAMAPPATVTPSITALAAPTSSPLALPVIGNVVSPTTYYIYPSVTVTGTIYTPTVNAASVAYGCNNLIFIRDVDTPAGTILEPGEKFIRTWKVANNGTCNWLYGYRLAPVSGYSFAQDSISVKNAPVPPGEWRELSIDASAPDDPGTYTQYWQLNDGAGHNFGSLLSISIVVGSPTKTPKPAKTKTPISTEPPTEVPTDPPTTAPGSG